MTHSDYYILNALDDVEILNVQSPSIIAYNLDLSREYVSKRLGELSDTGLVIKVEDGKYRISEKGKKFVAGDISLD